MIPKISVNPRAINMVTNEEVRPLITIWIASPNIRACPKKKIVHRKVKKSRRARLLVHAADNHLLTILVHPNKYRGQDLMVGSIFLHATPANDSLVPIGGDLADAASRIMQGNGSTEAFAALEGREPQASPHISHVISMRYSGVPGDHFRFPPNCPRCPPWACQPRRRSATTGRIVKSRGWSGPSNPQVKNEGGYKLHRYCPLLSFDLFNKDFFAVFD
jgi:hypothetical protein